MKINISEFINGAALKTNFKSLDWAEYRGYRYEPDENGRVCIFNLSTEYLTAVDTTAEADKFVDEIEAEGKAS